MLCDVFLCAMPVAVLKKVYSKVFKRRNYFKLCVISIEIVAGVSTFLKHHCFDFRDVYF